MEFKPEGGQLTTSDYLAAWSRLCALRDVVRLRVASRCAAAPPADLPGVSILQVQRNFPELGEIEGWNQRMVQALTGRCTMLELYGRKACLADVPLTEAECQILRQLNAALLMYDEDCDEGSGSKDSKACANVDREVDVFA